LFDAAKSEAKDPMKAARAYDKIVEQIDEAKNTTAEVDKVVDNVFLVVFPPAERQLAFRAAEALNKSTELDDFARELLDEDVAGLQERLEEEVGRLDGVNATNQRTGLELDNIADRLDLLPFGNLTWSKSDFFSTRLHDDLQLLIFNRNKINNLAAYFFFRLG
jgi:hypothetical protein